MAETRVADRYEPLEVIGRGGEATVVKAVDTRHERLVALKVRVVPPAGSSDEFLTEARALLSLPPHPGLAHARDDIFDNGRHVLVLDWVEGVNLARLLADEGRPGLPVSSVLRWIAQAAEALTALHQHGLVHGDVKPANLILDRDGRVVVVDLGSSSVPMAAAPRGGTPGFRAPEIAGGAPADRVSDVFSLAATAFTLLTGNAPTGRRPTWEGIPAGVAERLEAALRTGLSVDPARRPATPGELVERLRAGWDDQTPSGVGTVVLTDVVDSSKLWEQSPQRVPALLAEMQLIVDRNVEEHGGRRIGATVEGDATVSVFPGVTNAVRAAIGLQRGLASRSGALRVRVGVATGEFVGVDGEVLGPTLNRAARIRELAQAGEVLLSASTADVVRMAPPPGVDLIALGPHVLRGMDGADELAAVVAEGVSTPPDPARSPYPGLASFAPDEADLFFGREEIIERCLELFQTQHFVAVVGASGSGKSSLVLAGIAPRLAEFLVVRPGVDPRRSLEDACGPGHDGAVLIVDQLEELVTLCPDPSERVAFVDAIVAHPGGLIVAVRADLYGEFGVFDQLADRLAASQVLLGPLAEPDLLRAVHEPARRCGLAVEDGLAEIIAADLEDAPGALPLLGHALREAWLRREGRTITLVGYRDSGGVRTAIATTADRALAALDDEGQAVARRVLLRMVELRSDGDDARRWVTDREVTEIEPRRTPDVVATLALARLLVVDRDEITLVHEALLRAWPRLSGWIAEQRADLLARQEVRWAAERWAVGGRSDGDLYRGARLGAALELAAREPLPGQDAAFVVAGRQLRDRERSEAQQRARRLRVLAAVTSVLAVVALVVGTIAVVQRNDATQARVAADESARVADEAAGEALREAERADRTATEAEQAAADAAQSAIAADARRVGAQALVTENIDESLLMAVAGVQLDDSPDTRASLLATLTRHPSLIAATRSAEPLLTVDASFDGGVVAVGDPSAGVAFHDPVTLAPLGSFPDPPWTLKFRPGGTTMAMAANPYNPNGPQQLDPLPVVIVDASTFDPAATQLGGQPGPRASVLNLEYSADGRFLAAAFDVYGDDAEVPTAGAIAVWDLSAPEQPVRRFDANSIAALGGWIGLSPDGTLLYSGGFDGPVSVRDVATGALVRSVDIANVGGEVSPDGAVVAVAYGRDVVLLDAATLSEQRILEGHAALATLQFSRDGTRLASGYEDGTVIVWEVDTGTVQDRFDGHAGGVTELAFSPDGATLYTVSLDRSLLAWDLDGSRRFVATSQAPATPGNADYAIVVPTGDRVTYVGGLYGTLDAMQFLDLAENRMSPVIDVGHGGIGDVRGRPPAYGEVATSGRDRMVRVWDRDTGQLLLEHDVGGERISYSADGERIVVGSGEGSVTLIDADTLEPVAAPVRLGHGVLRVFTGPDNRTAIALTDEPGIALVDTVDRRVLYERGIEFDPISATVSPDGERVAVATNTGEVGVVDVATGDWVRPPVVGHRATVVTVAYAPDGNTLVSAGFDGRVTLWDGHTGALLGTVVVSENVATAAGFAPDGHTAVIASTDGTVARWDTRVEQWIATACKIVGRSLTPTEWADILADRTYIETCQ